MYKKCHITQNRKLIDSLVLKPIILYVYKCWGDTLKKNCFANKIEKFYV